MKDINVYTVVLADKNDKPIMLTDFPFFASPILAQEQWNRIALQQIALGRGDELLAQVPPGARVRVSEMSVRRLIEEMKKDGTSHELVMRVEGHPRTTKFDVEAATKYLEKYGKEGEVADGTVIEA